jgi:hypothetical protein
MSFFHQVSFTRTSGRRFQAWSASLFGLLLLTGCPKQEPALPPPPIARDVVPPDGGLHFDMRYYDSIEMTPRSPRTERELAISTQLHRLKYATKPLRNKQGQTLEEAMHIPKQPNDSVYEQMGEGNPVRGFANEAELLADIHRKIDSLKVLEHIPLTPH